MPKPVVNARHIMKGELEVNTDAVVGMIPNPIIIIIAKQVQKIVADSGYFNVTITIK
jgi:hypothetical protein